MKQLSRLKKGFFTSKNLGLFVLLSLCLVFACNKNNSLQKSDPNKFFNYSGNDTLVIKTIAQLKSLNDKEPFVDSLNNIGSFKWDVYIKSTAVYTGINNYDLMVPYVNNRNVLAGYIDISVTKSGIGTKPIAYNYMKDYLNNTDLLKRYLRGNVFQLFAQKNMTLTEGFAAMHITETKQIGVAYAPKASQQSSTTSVSSKVRALDAVSTCGNLYYITYLYYGAENQTNIPYGINNQYLNALQNAYGSSGANFVISSSGLMVSGPSTIFNQEITLGSLIYTLENVQGVSSVTSAQLLYGTCSGGGGLGSTPPVTITNNIKNPCLKQMVNTVINSGVTTIINQLIQNVFGGSSKINISYADGMTLPTGVEGYTPPVPLDANGNLNEVVNLNSNELPGYSQEFIATTIMHESLHAYLTTIGSVGQYQHEAIMTNFVTQMALDLQQMFPSISASNAKNLALSGLDATTAFKAQIATDLNLLGSYQATQLAYTTGSLGTRCH